MKPKDLIRILKQNGWKVVRIDGSHHVMKHSENINTIVVPLHNEDLGTGLFNKILKKAGLK